MSEWRFKVLSGRTVLVLDIQKDPADGTHYACAVSPEQARKLAVDLRVAADVADAAPREGEAVLRQDEYGRWRFVPKPIETLVFDRTPLDDAMLRITERINELVAAVNAIREGK